MQTHKSKSIVKFLATTLLTFMLILGFALPTSVILSNVQRYEATTVKAASTDIAIQGLKKSYTIGQTITLPTVSGATIIVKNPKNNNVELDLNNAFEATMAGDYSVEYKNGNTTTGEIFISVSASNASFNFDVANKKILPAEIATNTEVTFPKPEILDEEGQVISGANATLTIKKAGSSTPITTTPVEENSVSYEKYKFTEAGVYSVVYSYRGTGYNYVDQKYTIDVTNGYEDKVDLTYTLNGTMPTSLIQGVETELPKVTGKDKNNNNATVDVITTIEVEHLNAQGNYVAVEVKDYKFTPKNAGTYRIKYTVEDFYGNKYSKVYDPIENVRDTKAPTIKIVDAYAVETDGSVSQTTIDNLVDATNKLPSIVAVGTTVTLPAIFASDNVVDYKDMSLRRLIKSGTDQIANLDDTSVEAYQNNKVNETVNYTFDKAGTYTIIYKATDTTNTTSDSLYSYSIVVKEGFTDNVAPTVIVKEFVTDKDGSSIDIANPGDTIRVVKPTVVDYVDPSDASNKDTNDTRPTLQVFAQIEGDSASKIELTLSDEGSYYEYTIPSDASGKVQITYLAKDCSGNTGSGLVAEGLIKTLDIVNTNETSVPTLNGVTDSLGSINQYASIDLANGISVSDDIDTNVQLKAMIYLNGELIESDLNMTTMLSKSGAGSIRTIVKADFVANRSGSYVVNYVAYDHAGNYIVKSSTFDVVSKAVPVLVVNDYSTEMELGKAYIPQAKLYLEGQLQDNPTITTEVEGNINALGTVKVTYSATASNGVEAEEVVITITVKDTVKPTIILDGEVNEYVDLVQDSNDSTLYEEISLPGFTATDSGSNIDRSKYKIVVKNKNDVEVASENTANGIKFRPTGDGKYKVEYSATDYAGNTTTETFTINVGDVEKPTLTINNKAFKNAPKNNAMTATLKDGSYTLSIDASKITITDKGDTLDNDDYLSITVTNASGTAVSEDEDTDFVWTLTEAGEYTITITAEDEAGNVKSESYKLNLSAEETKASTTTEVLGTILLVVAILVLIGVVWYFVKPAPKSKKDKKKANKIEDLK